MRQNVTHGRFNHVTYTIRDPSRSGSPIGLARIEIATEPKEDRRFSEVVVFFAARTARHPHSLFHKTMPLLRGALPVMAQGCRPHRFR